MFITWLKEVNIIVFLTGWNNRTIESLLGRSVDSHFTFFFQTNFCNSRSFCELYVRIVSVKDTPTLKSSVEYTQYLVLDDYILDLLKFVLV